MGRDWTRTTTRSDSDAHHGTPVHGPARLPRRTAQPVNRGGGQAVDVMTKIGDVDMLDMDAPLTLETLHNIMAAGHRRGPRRGGAGTGAGGRAARK